MNTTTDTQGAAPARLLGATRYAAELIRTTEHEIARLNLPAAQRAEARDNAERQAAEMIARDSGFADLLALVRWSCAWANGWEPTPAQRKAHHVACLAAIARATT